MTVPLHLIQSNQTLSNHWLVFKFSSIEFSRSDWSELSMGMSADFEIAVEEGATWIRVGQAILGKRD
jgi:uncharacterized pyridoxal phosphate-containing UPF0001 family protein